MTNNPTYFMGESYGGHWVPYFSEIFLKNNTKNVNFTGK